MQKQPLHLRLKVVPIFPSTENPNPACWMMEDSHDDDSKDDKDDDDDDIDFIAEYDNA